MEEASAGVWLLPIRLVCADEEEVRRRIGDSFFNISTVSNSTRHQGRGGRREERRGRGAPREEGIR